MATRTPTRRLYYREPFLTRFTARILDARPDPSSAAGSARLGILLDSTAFYPTGGGQPHDTGTLAGLPVVDVRESEDGPLHILELREPNGEPRGTRITVGGEVEGVVDASRRFDHMQQHTGQHLLSRAFIEVAGAETLAFHLGDEICTIDVDLHSPEERTVRAAETRANEIIWEDRPVEIREISAGTTAAALGRERALAGLSLKPGDPIRIIEVDGFDATPCGGTHVRRSGQVGIAGVLGFEPYKGKCRVTFVCGNRVAQRLHDATSIVSACVARLSAPAGEVPDALDRLVLDRDTLRKRLRESAKALAAHEAADLARSAPESGGHIVLRKRFRAEERSVEEAQLLAQAFASVPGRIALVAVAEAGSATLLALRAPGEGVSMGNLIASVCAAVGGRGGGSAAAARAGGIPTARIEEAFDRAVAFLADASSGRA